MKKFIFYLLVLVGIFFLSNNNMANIIPLVKAGTHSEVRIDKNRLFVARRLVGGNLDKERLYTIKLLNWAPCYIGDGLGNYFSEHLEDIPLMKKMNINTVRTFGIKDHTGNYIDTAVLDKLYESGMMVVMTVIWGKEIADKAFIKDAVTHFMNHPGILMWSIGNEWNIPDKVTKKHFNLYTNLDDANAAVNQAAAWIKEAYLDAGLKPVPVVSSIVHWWDEGWVPFTYYENIVKNCPNVDVYGINMYEDPATYLQFLRQWREANLKPIVIAECGTDSYDMVNQCENQDYQAYYETLIWGTLKDCFSAYNPDNVLMGAGIFEFNDEWWKTGDNYSHDLDGGNDPDVIDGFRNEEWLGVVDIDRNLKKAYDGLAEVLPLRDYVNTGGSVNLRVFSLTDPQQSPYAKFYFNDQPYWRPVTATDARGRGMNVLVLDGRNLKIIASENFDTYEPCNGPNPNETAMRDFLKNIANNSLVMIGVSDTAIYWDVLQGNPGFIEDTYLLFDEFVGGVSKLRDVGSTNGQGYQKAYALIFKKNDDATFTLIDEHYDGTSQVTAQGVVLVENNYAINCDIEEAIAPNNAGLDAAAAMETELRYTAQATGFAVPDQQALYDYAKAHNLTANQGKDFVDSLGLKECLNKNQNPYYNFGIVSVASANEALAMMAYWLDNKCLEAGKPMGPMHIPAFVPLKNNYNSWLMLRGIHTDVNARDNQVCTVKAVWLRDFSVSPSQLGANVYVTVNDFINNYLYPLNTQDENNGKYVSVLEPPLRRSANIQLASYQANPALSLKDAVYKIMKDDVLPFNSAIGKNQKDFSMGDHFYVQDGRGGYWLVAVSEPGNRSKVKAALVLSKNNAFRALSWVDKLKSFFPVDKNKAVDVLSKALNERINPAKIYLVKSDNLFRPNWCYQSQRGLVYVTQEAKIIYSSIYGN